MSMLCSWCKDTKYLVFPAAFLVSYPFFLYLCPQKNSKMKRLCHLISDYMGILVLIAAVLALVFPETLATVRPTVINYLLGVVMFGMGLTLNLHDFQIVFSRPKDVIIGCLAQFTVMPLLAWILSRLFALDEALALGVVLVGCCPGGTASNVITYLAKGDLALSVGMTGVSTLLAPLMTPLLTRALAGKSVDVNVVSMFLSILWVVILPIAAGLVVKWLRLSSRLLVDSHCLHRGHHHRRQCQQAVGRRRGNSPCGDASQPLWTFHRLSHWQPLAPDISQEAGHINRSRHAKLRFGQQSGHHSFCYLSPRHHSRCHLQRVAQYQWRSGRLSV